MSRDHAHGTATGAIGTGAALTRPASRTLAWARRWTLATTASPVSSLERIDPHRKPEPLRLDWNESTIPASPLVLERTQAFLGNTHHLNWYPDQRAAELGMYACQLMRAARVVVDIGMHLGLRIPRDFDFHPGEVWSYELGVEFMRDRALMADEHARSDVVRYLGWPGQAVSYKVGQRVILEARETLRARPGFDLRAFHTKVLDLGSVGLSTLRDRLVA